MKTKLLILFFLVTSTFAQEIYELQILEKKLRAENIELKSYEHLEKMFLHKSEEVKTLPNPTFATKIFLLPVETRLGPQRFSAEFTQPIPYFGLLKEQAQKEKMNAELVSIKQAQKDAYLTLALRTYFFKMYENKALQNLLREYISQYNSLLRIATENLKTDKNSLSDILRLKQLLEETETEYNTLKNNYSAWEVLLQDLIETSEEIALPDTLLFPELSFEARPDSENVFLQSFQTEKRLAEQEMRINSLRNKPQFSVGASYVNIGKYDNPALSNVGRDAVALKFAMNLPLYQKKYSAFDDRQMEKIQALNLQEENLRQKFSAEIASLREKYEALKQNYELLRELIRLEKTIIKLKYSDFSVGKEDFDDLLNEEIKLLNYRKKIIKLIAQAYVLQAEYNFYLTR